MSGDKSFVVQIGERTHEKLAVHSVCNTTMAWDCVTEIFNLESSFQARSKNPPNGAINDANIEITIVWK